MRRLLPVLLISLALALVACDDEVKVVESCGDNFIDPGETCDGLELGGASCESLGHYNIQGTLRCSSQCTFDLEECGPRCGDENVDIAFDEECDGPNLHGQSCQTAGYSGGTLACGDDCRFDASGCTSVCGNRLRETGETCDDGGELDGDGCDANCQVETGWTCDEGTPNVCTSVCGDGFRTSAELCDSDDLAGATCAVQDFYEGAPICSETCDLDFSGCSGFCGDGEVQGIHGETCDGDDLNGATCADLGFYTGTPVCTDCSIDKGTCDGTCGDGIEQPAYEACDASIDYLCTEEGWPLGGSIACALDCQDLQTQNCWTAVEIHGAQEHTCARLSDGTARCWGNNTDGQLGLNSTTMDWLTPQLVVNLSNVVSLSTGTYHTCAVLADGTAKCWGNNADGQLGLASSLDQIQPVTVPSVTGMVAIAAGAFHTCALKNDGAVWCWGRNTLGQLGNNSTTNSYIPVEVQNVSGATAIAAGGSHTCALLTGGAISCWGYNNNGQLGDNSTGNKLVGTPVTAMTGALQVDAGAFHTCARLSAGTVRCWGQNTYGQLGDNSITNSSIPVNVVGPLAAQTLSAGLDHTCVVLTDGTARCWGSNTSGCLGNNQSGGSLVPVTVVSLTGATSIVAAFGFTCATYDQSRRMTCWGANTYGTLGNNTQSDSAIPVETSY